MARNAICRSCIRALRQQAQLGGIESVPSSRSTLHSITRTIPTRSIPKTSPMQTIRTYATAPASTATPTTTGSQAEIAPQPLTDEAELQRKAMETSDLQEQMIAQDVAETLFKECARQADYTVPQAFEKEGEVPKNEAGEDVGQGTGWWYDTLGLTPTFNTWFQITSLHLYLLIVRLRYLAPARSNIWQQHLTNALFYEAEHRMTLFHKISSRAIRNRYLKDMYNQWRGVQGAYDEGLVRGDAVLGAAVWRNVFKAREAQEVDWRQVAMIVSYIRRALKGLDGAKDESIRMGRVRFSSPAGESVVVEKPARGMGAGFEKEDEDAFVEFEKQIKSDSEKGVQGGKS